MTKPVKILIITASVLIILGGMIFVLLMSFNRWDFSNIGSKKFETVTFDITEKFDDVSIITDTADITFLPSEDGKYKVVTFSSEKEKNVVFVSDGTLNVNVNDERKWYDHINLFSFSSPYVMVYLPTGEYGTLTVKESTGDITLPDSHVFENIDITASTADVVSHASVKGKCKITISTGDVTLENLSVGSLDVTTTTGNLTASSVTVQDGVSLGAGTGDMYLNGLTCKNLVSTATTGDITLKNVIAEGKFDITRGTGNVTFISADATEIDVKTSTGEVEGTLRSEKIFIYDTSTGEVDLPETLTGGKCKLVTTTGDIKITIEN